MGTGRNEQTICQQILGNRVVYISFETSDSFLLLFTHSLLNLCKNLRERFQRATFDLLLEDHVSVSRLFGREVLRRPSFPVDLAFFSDF